MGPTIILDKSAIQSFSEKEINILSKYYTLNVTYNLYNEILMDLSKKYKDKDHKTQVIYLANKLNPNNFKINIHHRTILINELLGIPVPFSYRTLVHATEIITREDGKKGTIVKQTKEEEAIERWRDGIFSSDELKKAEHERIKLNELNLEEYRKFSPNLKTKFNIDLNKNNLIDFVNKIQKDMNTLSPLDKYSQLETLMNFMKIKVSLQNKIKERWFAGDIFDLFQFAPYTMFFEKIFNIFYLGTTYSIFGTRSSNIIDAEYLMYLPFCFVFCTGDNFQYDLCKMINDGPQYIISSTDLKSDLKLISQHIESGQDNSIFNLPKESLSRKIIEDYLNLENHFNDDDDLDFITLERKISTSAPCPCGSGNKFKDCCLDKVI